MPAVNQPTAEVDVDDVLVQRLLAEQHPDLADLDLVLVASGWDNVMFRLGNDLAVRLPRRTVAATLIEHEQRWLPELAPLLPVPIPAPVRVGVPGAGYPWRWTVCQWLPGRMAATAHHLDGAGLVDDLAGFLDALHRPAPHDAPPNPVRGVPLRDRDESMRARAAQVAELIDSDAVLGMWESALALPPWSRAPVWLHGDLHPANVLVDERGRLAAVVDFGDITAGDPACDLAVAWMLFDEYERSSFRAAVGPDDATWDRARGWALQLAVAYVANSADNPVIAEVGRRTLAAVLGD
jgi:aminoglycoside phosphotransferase (APT) family kinase protein